MRLILVILIAAVSVVATSAPASAHADKVYHGRDFAIVDSSHTSGSVCDEERDGNDVTAHFFSDDGERWTADAHGASGPCDNVSFGGQTAEYFEVCEVGVGCRSERT